MLGEFTTSRRDFIRGGSAAASLAAHPGDLERLLIPDRTPPSDLIPPSDLESRYHIRIHDLSDQVNYVKFGIREGELEEPNSMLRRLAARGETLDIIVLNGHLLHPRYLTASQRANCPDAERALSESSVLIVRDDIKRTQEASEGMIRSYRAHLSMVEIQRASGTMNSEQCDAERDFAFYTYQKFLAPPFGYFLPEGPLRDLYLFGTLGYCAPRVEYLTALRATRRHNYVFAIGRNPPIRVVGSGAFRKIIPPFYSDICIDLKSSQNYPRIEDIKVEDTTSDGRQREYPIVSPYSLLTVISHENEHVKDIPHPATDYRVLDRLDRAERRYQQGDNRGYFLWAQSPIANVIS